MTWNQGADQFLTALSSSDPTPGGGAAAAMAGAMGCALTLMAIGTSLKRKSTPITHQVPLQKAQQTFSQYKDEMEQCMAQDAQAYNNYISAYRLPKEDSARPEALQNALWEAALVPANAATLCTRILQEISLVQPFIAPIILSDVYCAQHLLKGALACCVENIRVNLEGITSQERREKLNKQLTTFITVLNK